MKINWKVRFSKDNLQFILRFIGALLVPIFAYLGINFEDINNWGSLWSLVMDFLSNPYLLVLTIINAINLLPDPTTPGLSDSKRALFYHKPGGGMK